ncbi:MAG: hypothetical protein LC674_06600 [Actinobacteria bacterium]|nr:hypothetical protein [Actinomycetota bacterium]
MKLSDEEITTLFSFVKGALKRVAEETEREMLWDYHDKITSLKQYLDQLKKSGDVDTVLIESIEEKVDEEFDIARA